MKNLLLISLIMLVVSCEKKKEDCAFEGVANVGANLFAKKYECNEDKVREMFMKGLVKSKMCKGVSYSGINLGNIACSIIPPIVSSFEGYSGALLECKKSFEMKSALKEILKCK